MRNRRISLPKMKRKSNRQPAVWKQVKTTCIAVLLACNMLLLAVLGGTAAYNKYLSYQTRSHMDAILAERGVLCGSSVYAALEEYPQAYTLRTDSNIQQAFAEVLLTGTIMSQAETGNTMVWTGGNGTVSWASSGEISAEVGLYHLPQPIDTAKAQRMIYDLLREAGFPVKKDQLHTTQTDSGYTIEINQKVKGVELLGCSMTVRISAGNETTIEGTWCTGDVQPLTVRALQSYSAEQVLFQFMEAQGAVSQIISVQPVYVLSDKSGGRFTAIPCWRFSTDQGDYVLNILTGAVVASADLGEEDSNPAEEMPDLDDDYNDDSDIDDDYGMDDEDFPTDDSTDEDTDVPWDER